MLSVDFSSATLQARRQWANIFKGLQEKNKTKQKIKRPSRIIYLAKVSFKNDREMKTILHEENLRVFVFTRLVLEEIIKVFLQVVMKGHWT